jgi:hypothetical protein
LTRRPTSGYGLCAVAAERLDLFRRFCAEHLCVESGAPLALEPVQGKKLEDYFGGVREIVSIEPKKVGKTTLVAGVAIFELVTNPDFRIAIAANARDQAQRRTTRPRGSSAATGGWRSACSPPSGRSIRAPRG